jgi:hypothetical protein
MQTSSIINPSLLWECSLDSSSDEQFYKIVIERVLKIDNLEDWRDMVKCYSQEQILETIEWSVLLKKRDKDFSKLFLTSDFLTAKDSEKELVF